MQVSVLSLQQADVFRLLQNRNTRWLTLVINLLLVAWIASLLAAFIWNLAGPLAGGEAENIEHIPLPVTVDPNMQLIRQLPDWHLMGVVAQKRAPEVVNTQIDAPDTPLKLVLHGVFASDKNGQARAIIADPQGKEEQYAVGETLPVNAELSEVYPDRVILKRNGRYETLRLLMQDSPSAPRAAIRRTKRTGGKLLAQQEQVLRELREKMKQTPITLFEIVSTKPYTAGGSNVIGYTLQPGPAPELFKELGLQAGDVALQINDVRFDSAQSGMRAMKSVKSGDTAILTILRDGQEQSLSIMMPE